MSNSANQSASNMDRELAAVAAGDNLVWTDILTLDLEGSGWSDTLTPYDRFCGRAKPKLREAVWNLSLRSAGMAVRFVTDATNISARWTLRFEDLAMPHMPATGMSGLDLYARVDGKWLWAGSTKPKEFPTNEAELAWDLAPGEREYMLYLPLYNGVTSVEIGVPAGAKLKKAAARAIGKQTPVVIYGTSIVHGASSSRPGTAYPAILGRWLDKSVINLGFSGNAKLEVEVAELLGELDPQVYVIDALPNNSPNNVADRIDPFLDTLRAARPLAPIVLIEQLTYGDAVLFPKRFAKLQSKNVHLKASFDRRIAAGDKNLYYIEGDLLGDDREATVDPSHPTTLGMMRLAEGIAPTLQKILNLVELSEANLKKPTLQKILNLVELSEADLKKTDAAKDS